MPPDKQQVDLSFANTMMTVVSQVGCVNVLLVGLGLGLGILIDNLAGTGRVFTAILTIASVPVALYFTMRLAMRAIEKTQRAAEAKKKQQELQSEESKDI